jgi:hypothetical protein
MRHHTTHWTRDGALHAGAVASCAECVALHLEPQEDRDRSAREAS